MYGNKPGDQVSHVNWNINGDQLAVVHPDYKSDIEKKLIFFLQYISTLRSESTYLTFEINDAAFDATSARSDPFGKATIYAIINCFDSDILSYNEDVVETLKNNNK